MLKQIFPDLSKGPYSFATALCTYIYRQISHIIADIGQWSRIATAPAAAAAGGLPSLGTDKDWHRYPYPSRGGRLITQLPLFSRTEHIIFY